MNPALVSGNEAWNRTVFRRWREVDRDGADITLSGRLFQTVGPATGKARPPSWTNGTSRRLVRAGAGWTLYLRPPVSLPLTTNNYVGGLYLHLRVFASFYGVRFCFVFVYRPWHGCCTCICVPLTCVYLLTVAHRALQPARPHTGCVGK